MPDDQTTLLMRCALLATSTWSDALDHLRNCGAVLHGLVQRSGRGRFAGFAATAREVAGQRGEFPASDFGVGRMIAALEPGQVLMVDVAGAEISTFGGLAALATRSRGAAAVVIDGGCRDIEEIRATGLWVASRSVTPTTGKTRLKLEAIGEPVAVAGVRVNSGDLMVGDDTGIVAVPREALDRVLSEAQRMHALDAALQQGAPIGKALPRGRGRYGVYQVEP